MFFIETMGDLYAWPSCSSKKSSSWSSNADCDVSSLTIDVAINGNFPHLVDIDRKGVTATYSLSLSRNKDI